MPPKDPLDPPPGSDEDVADPGVDAIERDDNADTDVPADEEN